MVCEAMSTHENRVDFPLNFIRIPHIQNIHVCVNEKLLLLLLVQFLFFLWTFSYVSMFPMLCSQKNPLISLDQG